MTDLAPIVLASWAIALALRNPLIAVAVGGMTPTGSFIIAGDIGLPTVYASALFALAANVLLARGRAGAAGPLATRSGGITVLWLFALWAAAVTVLAPLLFEGTQVIALGGSRRLLSPETLLTSSNIAQLLYLVLGVAVASIAAGQPKKVVWLVFATLTGTALLSIWRYLNLNAGIPFPIGLFDNSPGFRYIDFAPGGVVRFRGIFSEPASLAVSSLAAVATGLALLRSARGARLVVVVIGVCAAAFNLSQSTSATGEISAVVLIALSLVVGLLSYVLSGRRWPAGTLVLWIAGAVAAIWFVPIAIDYVSTIVGGKVGTDSYDERSGTDAYSYGLVWETWGLGVGVGSNRPSSFLAALLAATGVVGAGLFFGVMLVHTVKALRIADVRPLLWCLTAIMFAKILSSPDLSDTSGVLWMTIGGIIGGVSADRAKVSGSAVDRVAIGPDARRHGPGTTRAASR